MEEGMKVLQIFHNYEEANKDFINRLASGYTLEQLGRLFEISIERVINILDRSAKTELVMKSIIKHYDRYKINDNKIFGISDTHIGNSNDALHQLFEVYNLAYQKNIKYIVHAGDFIEGKSNPYQKSNPYDQINRLKYIYNQIKNINTYYIYGNHDYNLYLNDSIDLKEQINEIEGLRYIGRGNSYIKLVDDDFIKIHHYLSYDETHKIELDRKLDLEGHHHFYKKQGSNIFLPPLSLVNGQFQMGFIELETLSSSYFLKRYGFDNVKPIVKNEKVLVKKR